MDRKFFSTDYSILLSFALFKLALHLVVNAMGGYGYFRDEFYYIACSDHLDWGFVDQPPLSIFILAINRLLFGDSLFALRLLPAIAGAMTVFLTGLITRELGGGRRAQVLACLAAVISPANLAMSAYYSMNAFEVLIWTLAAYFIVHLLKAQQPRYWIILGILLGLGLLNKISILWLGCGTFIGFLLTPHRHWLKTTYPWLAGVIAFLLFLPYIIWNFTHDFAHLEFIRNATQGKYSGLTAISFIVGQILPQNPQTLPLWLAGILFYFVTVDGKSFRALGYVYVVVFVILILNQHTKAEYLSPAYGMLFAAGGVMMERWFSRSKLRWLMPTYAIILVAGLIAVPFAVPILPVETYIRYADAWGVTPSTAENKELGKLPQHYADMFGWNEMAETVANVFNKLPENEKSHCIVYGQNYGEAGAIDFLGKKYGLPRVVSGHNNYWLWGPGNADSNIVVIVVGGTQEDHQRVFENVERVAIVQSEYAMPYENNLPVFVCRKLKIPIEQIWSQIKNFS